MSKTNDIRRELFSNGRDVRKKFKKDFPNEINIFIDNYDQIIKELCKFKRNENNKRHAYIEMFFLNSINSLLISMKLLLNGLIIPSCFLMRSFYEALCISLLCSSEKINTFSEIENKPNEYPYQKAPIFLRKKENIEEFSLNKEIVNLNEEIYKYYNNYSHSTYFTNYHLYIEEKQGNILLGEVYDEGKRNLYEIELQNRIYSCNLAIEFMRIIIEKQK